MRTDLCAVLCAVQCTVLCAVLCEVLCAVGASAIVKAYNIHMITIRYIFNKTNNIHYIDNIIYRFIWLIFINCFILFYIY